jgi:hypothetical protein
MKEVYYIYNNEAIASCIFLSVLNKDKELDIARSCLILPFLLDDRTINHLKKEQESNINLEQLTKDHPRLFVSFNKRYLSLLPITINALMILSKGNQINIENQIKTVSNLNFENEELGSRFLKIEDVIPKFLTLLDEYSTGELYKILQIQL